MKIEYRIIPVTRFVVTRYEDDGGSGSVGDRGEYGNAEIAYEVGHALCKAEHDAAGDDIDGPTFEYPSRLVSTRPTR